MRSSLAHTSVEDAGAGQPRCGGRFPASLRRKRPSRRHPIGGASATRRCVRPIRLRWRRRAGGSVPPHTSTAPCWCSARAGDRQDELLARRLAASPRPARRPERVLVLIGATPGDRAAIARPLSRRCSTGPYEELWVGELGRDRRAAAARARRGGRPRSLLRRARAGRAAGGPARPLRRAAAAPPRDPRQPGRAPGPPAGADRPAEGERDRRRRRSPSWPGARREEAERASDAPSPRRPRKKSASSPSSSTPTTGSSPQPAASTAATSSSPSTACWSTGPTCAASSPRASRR